jgi:hypothetical protein
MKHVQILQKLSILVIIILWAISCKKDYSYEGGIITFVAKGSLQDTLGNCQGITVRGAYIKDSALTANNYITVNANITVAGKYRMYTDTVNGCYFLDSGTVLNTGLQSFKLQGYGKPISPVFGSFAVHFDSTVCSFVIPTDSAVYTFNSPMGSCPNIKVSGRYFAGATLNTADTVSVPIAVTVPGAYSMEIATTNGMSFSSNGIFPKTGNYNITLKGYGSPYNGGVTTMPINVANVNCSFQINVLIDTSMNWQFTAEGKTHWGFLDSINNLSADTGYFLNNNNNRIFGLDFYGNDTSLAYSLFAINISRINHNITIGNYHPAPLGSSDFVGSFYLSVPALLYSSTNSLPTFTVNIAIIDLNTRLVQCTFSGPVLNASGQTVNITNGFFKTYLTH